MNIRNINILRTFAALLLCIAVGSCSQGELDVDQGRTLPPGVYPLMFTATVDGMMSRADEESEPWGDGDMIATQIVGYSLVGHYVLNTDGSVKKSDDPLAWPVDKGIVIAWYPGEDLPFSKGLTDQSEGFHDIDFLYAVSEEKSYKETVPLVFKHKMAKVRCVLKKGEGITEEDLKTAALTYRGYTSASFSGDAVTPSGDGRITPYSYYNENSGYIFEALLAPQNMSGKDFIKVNLTVTINGTEIDKELTYTPTDLNLEAGSAYTFNVTVQKDRLVVEPITASWNDVEGENAKADLRRVYLPDNHGQTLKFSSNTTLAHDDEKNLDYLLLQDFEFSISFKANDENRMSGFLLPDDTHKVTRSEANGNYIFEFKLDRQVSDDFALEYGEFTQVGDFYYADGSWGRYHPDAWSEENNPDGVKIIGIVFKVGVYGTGPKNDPGNVDIPENYSSSGWKPARIKGYVVALEDASPNTGSFAPATSKTYCPPSVGTGNGAWNNAPYSGYINTYTIRTSSDTKSLYESTDVNAPNVRSLWAFKVAAEYKPAPPLEKSCGWYLPSARQWDDILHLYGLRSLLEEAGGTTLVNDYSHYYWSCTEANNPYTWVFFYNQDSFASKGKNNTTSGYVRSVLTF